jgi:2-polyprenyl-3-methyl-5-hydroxy-6-metoxy-1,4-benzoquinol methylase
MFKKLKALADNTESESYATKMRLKRFSFFHQLVARMPKPIRILDVGGTQKFWQTMGFPSDLGISVILLNLQKQPVSVPGFSSTAGDATDLRDFRDQEFDIVFSNSVIEHVGDYAQQERMAQEVQRVGVRYFVQTPNYYFPLEPHFLFPGFQWLPVTVRTLLMQHFQLGWMPKTPVKSEARRRVEDIRLLSLKEIQTLFPKAQIYQEKAFGLTKSFIAYGGWKSI